MLHPSYIRHTYIRLPWRNIVRDGIVNSAMDKKWDWVVLYSISILDLWPDLTSGIILEITPRHSFTTNSYELQLYTRSVHPKCFWILYLIVIVSYRQCLYTSFLARSYAQMVCRMLHPVRHAVVPSVHVPLHQFFGQILHQTCLPHIIPR